MRQPHPLTHCSQTDSGQLFFTQLVEDWWVDFFTLKQLGVLLEMLEHSATTITHQRQELFCMCIMCPATVSALSFRIPRPELSRLSCLVIISCRTKTEEQRRVNCGRIQIIFQSINIVITHNIYHHQQYRISIIFNGGWWASG